MINYENFFQFEYWQYEVIRHAFSFTAAVFAASLIYFAMSARSVIPRFRNTAYISAVVMVSAFLELGALWVMWNGAYTYDAETMKYVLLDGQVFSNGYRYANWLIDVPMLLTQFVVVLGFVGAAFFERWRKLTALGVLMILTGYVGQYYEPQVFYTLRRSREGNETRLDDFIRHMVLIRVCLYGAGHTGYKPVRRLGRYPSTRLYIRRRCVEDSLRGCSGPCRDEAISFRKPTL